MREIRYRIRKPWVWGDRVYINVPPAVREYIDENKKYDVILIPVEEGEK
jgi:hypothetical protein